MIPAVTVPKLAEIADREVTLIESAVIVLVAILPPSIVVVPLTYILDTSAALNLFCQVVSNELNVTFPVKLIVFATRLYNSGVKTILDLEVPLCTTQENLSFNCVAVEFAVVAVVKACSTALSLVTELHLKVPSVSFVCVQR